jgi:hypothetical protein
VAPAISIVSAARESTREETTMKKASGSAERKLARARSQLRCITGLRSPTFVRDSADHLCDEMEKQRALLYEIRDELEQFTFEYLRGTDVSQEVQQHADSVLVFVLRMIRRVELHSHGGSGVGSDLKSHMELLEQSKAVTR